MGTSTRAHRNVAVVALANKLARIAWAVLRRQERFAVKNVPADVLLNVAMEVVTTLLPDHGRRAPLAAAQARFFFYVPNLIVAEAFIRNRQLRTRLTAKLGAALILSGVTVLLAVGTYYFTVYHWGPSIMASVLGSSP
jgi:hypothetical protein